MKLKFESQTWVALKLLTWHLTRSLWAAKVFVSTGRCILAETGDTFCINALMSETRMIIVLHYSSETLFSTLIC